MISPATPTPPKLLDVNGVAELLQCTPRNVYRLADSGKMPAPLKIGGLNRWPVSTLESWLESGCQPVRHVSAKPVTK
jgi:excisionase family DNA binding protein